MSTSQDLQTYEQEQDLCDIRRPARAAAAGSPFFKCGRPAGEYHVSGARYPVLAVRYQVLVLGIRYWNPCWNPYWNPECDTQTRQSQES